MSSLRRLWLSWGGWGRGLLIAAIIHLIIAITVLAYVRSSPETWGELATHLFLDRPPLFMFLPFLLGFHLRQLLDASESLALADRHTQWHVRVCLLGLLPLVAAAIATFILLLGGTPLHALSVAVSVTVLGAWMGFGSVWAFLCFFAYSSGFPHLMAIAELRGPGLGVLLLVALAGGVWAWHRLHHRHWCDPRHRMPRLEHLVESLQRWVDGVSTTRWPTRMPAATEPPGLRTFLRLALAFLANARRLHLTVLLLSIVVWFLVGRFPLAHDPAARLGTALGMTLVFVLPGVAGWLLPLANRTLRDVLAVQRLWPMSRRRSAAAALFGAVIGGLANTGALIGGMVLGLLAADLSRGVWPTGPDAWLLVSLAPFAIAVTAAASAAYLICLTVPAVVAIMGFCLSLLGLLFLPPLLFPAHFSGSTIPPHLPFLLLGLAGGTAVLLVPLAWYRLAKAELP